MQETKRPWMVGWKGDNRTRKRDETRRGGKKKKRGKRRRVESTKRKLEKKIHRKITEKGGEMIQGGRERIGEVGRREEEEKSGDQ